MGTKTQKETYELYLRDNIWKEPRILRNREEIKRILDKKNSTPIHVEIDLIESCNLRCRFCYFHGKKSNIYNNSTFNGHGIFPFNRLLELIHELKESGTKSISFTGSGETLLYSNIYHVFQEILNNRIEYGITSNLNARISDEDLDILSKASWIRCSLNSSTNKGYIKVHKPRSKNCDINNVLDNIGLLPNINISYVIIKENIEEIVKTTELVKSLGANSISFRKAMTFDNKQLNDSVNAEINKEIAKAKELGTNVFKVYDTVKNLKSINELLCYYSNHSCYIDAHGDVYPCCIMKYDKKYKYGNILNMNFIKLWNSQKRKENYKTLNMKNCPPCTHFVDNSMLELLYNEENIKNCFI